MRWRVPGINAELRQAARQAAKTAGLPLGLWLERAILQQAGPVAGSAPLDAAETAPQAPAAELAHIEPAEAPPEPAPQPTGEAARDAQASHPVIRRFARLVERAANRRMAAVIALVVSVAAVALAVVWLRPGPAMAPGSHQAATAPGSPLTPAPAQTLPDIIAQLQRDALAGEATAQHDLALAYVDGRGVPQNYEIAAAWFEKAAQAGLERAQFNLAVLYENALGVPQDFERAFALYSAAAEQGFAAAQHNTAVAYAQGRGTERDYRAAALWFRRAAEQGIASAQFNLGMIYEKGLAGPPDEQTAYGWYRLAAAAGSESAIARLAVIEGRIAPAPAAKTGGGQAPTRPAKPTPAEIAEIQRLLGQLSFSPGTPDGKVGPATRAAIRQYEQIAALPVTGDATVALLTHLRQVTGMMAGANR